MASAPVGPVAAGHVPEGGRQLLRLPASGHQRAVTPHNQLESSKE